MPFIIEFVGVAGTGKTTVSQALSERNPFIHRCQHPNPRNLSDSTFFIKNCLKLWMKNLHTNKEPQQISRREFAWMAILLGWPDYLRNKYAHHHVIALDQGPIFLITALHHYDLQELMNSLEDNWWREIYQSWSNTIDSIVFFDATNDELRKRIRGREKSHFVKETSDLEINTVLSMHRTVYKKAISCLVNRNDKPKLLTIRTDDCNVAEISDMLMIEFGL
jgi:gluconate kinase